MISPLDTFEQRAKNFEVLSLRWKSKPIFFKEWNDYILQILAIKHFEPITVLMINPGIFLKINASTLKEIFQGIQDFFISFDEFYIKSWFYANSSNF